MERPIPAEAGIAGFPTAEPAWAGLVLAKKLLEGPRIPEVILGLGLAGIGLLAMLSGWIGLAGTATTGVDVLLTLADGLGLGEAGRLAAGGLVRLPPSALLLLLCAKAGSANRGSNKASAMPTCNNLAFAVLYLPINMADLLNYV